jgi:hypothetical protein
MRPLVRGFLERHGNVAGFTNRLPVVFRLLRWIFVGLIIGTKEPLGKGEGWGRSLGGGAPLVLKRV